MPIDKTLLPAKINAFIAGKLQGKTAATALAVYSSQDPYYQGLGRFIRNPSCWLNGVTNISCFSPAQLSGANWWQRAGTLITPRHVLFAKHFAPAIITNGTPLVFVAADNTVIRRNVMQYALHPWTDIAIGLLNADVPANILPAKVLPKDYATYFDIAATPLYSVGLDQQEKALVKRAAFLTTTLIAENNVIVGSYKNITTLDDPNNDYTSFNELMITGDSGNPWFVIIDNELAVLTAWYFGGQAAGGPFISDQFDKVNELINTLSPGQGYALTPVDLARSYETMRKLYFNSAGDGSLTTLANWYQDSALTVPATALPATQDIPVLPWAASGVRVTSGPGVLATL